MISGKNAWRLFDEAGIEGFGTNLIRLYFPVYYDKKNKRQSFSPAVQQDLAKLITSSIEYKLYDQAVIDGLKENVKLSLHQTNDTSPYLDNFYFGIFDAAVLYAVMNIHKPKKIIEIGSGISTRYINFFKRKLSLNTQIVCIDPEPRAIITSVADTIITQPLENAVTDDVFNLQSGDIVFMDGSHYVFQGNDTLTFFFTLLPSLPKGVIIHIHDIYLPFDYSESTARQLWTEQYILAAMMLGGFSGFEVLYPAYYMSQTNKEVKQALAEANNILEKLQFTIKLNHKEGYSFWIRKT